MIIDLVPVMSAIDGLILGIVLAGFGYGVYRRREIQFGNAKFGSILVGIGLLMIAGFYSYELALMHAFPSFMSMEESMDLMRDLHLNQSWIVKLFATGFIVWGFISLVSRLAFINLKLEMLVQERMSDLAESELRHKKAQSMVHLGSWAWNIKTGEENWSIEQYKIFGLDPDGAAASYDDFLNAVHPDDRQSVLTDAFLVSMG